MKKMELKETIEKFSRELLGLLNMDSSIEVVVGEENGIPKNEVVIETKESNILIGYHGETLESLEYLLNQMVFKETGSWANVVVDVGSYKKERKEKIQKIVENAISKVRFAKERIELLPMKASERKLVHEIVNEDKDLVSYSVGENHYRKVVIDLKGEEEKSSEVETGS